MQAGVLTAIWMWLFLAIPLSGNTGAPSTKPQRTVSKTVPMLSSISKQ
jgi:hypothetical protein